MVKQQVDSLLTSIGNALPGFGTTNAEANIQTNAAKKAQCEANGGVWDGTKCVFNSPTSNPTTPNTDVNHKDIKFNADGSVTITKGGVSTTLTKEQYNDSLKVEMGQGRSQEPAVQQATKTGSQIQAEQLTPQVMATPQITEADILKAVPQEPGLETLQTTGAGIVGGVAGGFGGAALGAKIGALGGTAALPGIGTLIGAGLGALVGLIGSAYTKIAIDKRNDVKQAFKVGKIANTNFGQTIDALNAGIINKDVALKRWKQDKISLYAARENLKRETDKELDRFLSGGADELAQIDDYIEDLETMKEREFLMALAAPNPQNLKYIYQNGVSTEE